jgi:hypothetical protein
MKSHRTSILVFVLLILSIVFSACGPSPEQVYLEKVNAPIAAYNAKFDALSTKFESLSAIKEPKDTTSAEWQAEITAVLDELDKAAVDLGSATGAAPESCAALDGYLTEIASSTTDLTTSYRDLFAVVKEFSDEINRQTAYVETMVKLTLAYNEKLTAITNIFEIPDNPADPAWQSKSAAAIDELEKAAAALGNISAEVPEPFTSIDGALKQVTVETNTLTKNLREILAYFASGDNEHALQKAQESVAIFQKIGEVMQQVKIDDVTNTNSGEEAFNAKLKEIEAATSKLVELIAKANGEIDKLNTK